MAYIAIGQGLYWPSLLASLCASVSALSPVRKLRSTNDMHRHFEDPHLKGCYGIECVERYVALDDGAFTWSTEGSTKADGVTSYSLTLTSQKWMADAMVGHDGRWIHQLYIVIPDSLKSTPNLQTWATLFVNEDRWLPEEMARRTGIVSVSMTQVPKEGVELSVDEPGVSRGQRLDEETLQALSWINFARWPSHPEWPVSAPGTKAVVKAMDATQAFLEEHGCTPPSQFIVSGASKRGIISYMTGLVDARVKGLIPLIIAPNMEYNGKLRQQSYGPTDQTRYEELGVFHNFLIGEARDRVRDEVDPIGHTDRLRMPKLVLNVGNDYWFTPDAHSGYWSDLPSPKSFYMFANAPHIGFQRPGSAGHDFLDTADAWINGLVMSKPEPQLSWTIDDTTGELTVNLLSKHNLTSVQLWKAVTKDGSKRDFRPVRWESTDLSTNLTRWQVTPNPPAGRWEAMFVSFTFQGPKANGKPWKLSTEASILPKVMPFPFPDYDTSGNATYSSLPAFTVRSLQ